jgi:hypothetical protein
MTPAKLRITPMTLSRVVHQLTMDPFWRWAFLFRLEPPMPMLLPCP